MRNIQTVFREASKQLSQNIYDDGYKLYVLETKHLGQAHAFVPGLLQ